MDKIFGKDSPTSGIFYDRNNSAIIKYFMKCSGMPTGPMANYLGCSTSYFNNKLARNSFSIEDLMVASYVCRVGLGVIDPWEYISNIPDTKRRIETIRVAEKKALKDWYYATKEELEAMNKIYGFEEESNG